MTWSAICLRSMPVLQCGHADGSSPIELSAMRERMGSAGSVVRHTGHALARSWSDAWCARRQSAQKR
eukprot:CAMPEP_0185460750 /NCGR_PEP_ID=MMETSP1365-20130426/88207_1 /TAXON_ID=38817 /ORGANISM="Gephyrocapsa oceanica, Strain RCC1303" /LENGTH=66 /DNA_ID=CAMNT_0028067379 /DNA_START=7 /DNA_END=207 /DNA_ORIENTATION=-